MTELEKRVQSGIAGIRAYLDAKLTGEAVTAAERLMELAHELGRDHPLYVEAARAASLAYAFDRNPGMSARYMHQAVAAADHQPAYPKDRRGHLHLECARAALEGGELSEAVSELDQAIDLLIETRKESETEARSALLLRLSLLEATGDPRSEMATQLHRLRDFLAPIYTNPESSALNKALADHDMVSGLCVSARLAGQKAQWDLAISLLSEAYARAEAYVRARGSKHPHLFALVNEVHKDLRRVCRGESTEVRNKVDSALHPLALQAEKLFWNGFREALEEARAGEGFTDQEAATLLEQALRERTFPEALAAYPAFWAHAEVLLRHALTGTHLHTCAAEELRHVMRGDKPLANAIVAMEEAGLLDV